MHSLGLAGHSSIDVALPDANVREGKGRDAELWRYFEKISGHFQSQAAIRRARSRTSSRWIYTRTLCK